MFRRRMPTTTAASASSTPAARWREQFPKTPLWRAVSAGFMPPVAEEQMPGELVERFAGPAHEALTRLLVWLSPGTVRAGEPVVIELNEAW